MPELLLELFSEEIPARMQTRAAADLRRLAVDALKAADLAFDGAESYATPRRLALAVDGLPRRQPDRREEKRGPRTSAPEKALAGFLRANGVTLEQCERRRSGKDEYWFATLEHEGADVSALLPGLVTGLIAAVSWPKSMRWGAGETRWVRTLERVLCVFDGEPVALALPDGIASGAVTSGHRFHAPDPFPVSSFADYRGKLRAARVILDPAERRRIVADGAAALAAAEGLAVRDDPGLLDEVVGLVEWPVPLIGRIDRDFMTVPDEVLITSTRSHQKYFSLLDPDGSLAPRFIVVANLAADDGGGEIVAGNERVLRARLSDARFFWDQDREKPLSERIGALAPVVFHARLGSLARKAERLEALAGRIAAFVPGADAGEAARAGRLAKADLTTEMVLEFPELQGVMGGHYARHDGEAEGVARAVAEHYLPVGPSGACPSAPASIAVALADKIDTLVGFFAVGERPTGSGDPYALRRAALGVIRLVLENGIRLPLLEAFRSACRGYDETVPGFGNALEDGGGPGSLERDLLAFFADRLKVHLRTDGVRHDLISAVFALGGEDDLVRLCARVEALRLFLAAEDGANLLTAYRRAANIVAIEERKDGAAHDGPVEPSILEEPEERALSDSLGAVGARSVQLLEAEAFDGAMAALAGLRAPVDAFFDRVKVNADDAALRANRLRLLSRIRETMGGLADFSRIEG